jgi:hypothetical protein
VVFLACWALGPVLGAGLAAHELEHHESGDVGPAGADERVLPFVHGHFHEEGTSSHSHELVPPTAPLSTLSGTKQLSSIVDKSRDALRNAGLALRPPLLDWVLPKPGPEPPSPASLQHLCVLRL